jgi:hypothetical protein
MSNDISKSIQDNDESSSTEQARLRRQRTLLRQRQQWHQQQRHLLLVMTRNAIPHPAPQRVITPIQQRDIVPQNSLERISSLRLPTLRRNATNSSNVTNHTRSTNIATSLNRDEFMEILDCALAICDEFVENMQNPSGTSPNESCE